MSFGVSVIPIRFQALLGPWENNGRVIGLVAAALFAIFFIVATLLERTAWIRRQRDTLLTDLKNDLRASTLVLAGAGTFLTSYIVGTSYDYRLIFLSLVVGGLLLVGKMVLASSLTALMWASSHWTLLGDSADIIWLLVAPALLVVTVRISLLFIVPNRTDKMIIGANPLR